MPETAMQQRVSTELSLNPFDKLQAWLQAEPASDLDNEISNLATVVRGVRRSGLGGAAALDVLVRIELRTRDALERLKPQVLEAALPLPGQQRSQVARLVAAVMGLAELYQELVTEVATLAEPDGREATAVLTAQALHLLRNAFVVSCLAASPVPYGLWLRAHALGRIAIERQDCTAAALAYRQLLALSVSRPEGLSARELVWLDEYFGGCAHMLLLNDASEGTFAFDPQRDQGPQAGFKLGEVPGVRLLSLTPLVRKAGVQLQWLARQVDRVGGRDRGPEALAGREDGTDLPEGLTLGEQLVLLRSLREHWARPPLRVSERHPGHHESRMCAGLSGIWEMLQSGETQSLAGCEVINHSDGGFGVVANAQDLAHLEKGMPIVLSFAADQPWIICLVRWIKASEAQIEFGLQTLGRVDAAVEVRFGIEGETVPVRGLWLPPLDGVRRQPALMVPAGTYTGHRFTLVREGAGLYVAQAHLLTLEIETPVCEVFQFQIDPYSN